MFVPFFFEEFKILHHDLKEDWCILLGPRHSWVSLNGHLLSSTSYELTWIIWTYWICLWRLIFYLSTCFARFFWHCASCRLARLGKMVFLVHKGCLHAVVYLRKSRSQPYTLGCCQTSSVITWSKAVFQYFFHILGDDVVWLISSVELFLYTCSTFLGTTGHC